MKTVDYENYHETKDHYNNEFSYNTYLCTIPLDFPEVPIHWHNEMELIYVKNGSAVITIDMEDYDVSSGCLAVVLPGHIHGIVLNNSLSDSVEYENIIFNINMLFSKHGDDMTNNFFIQLLNNDVICPCVISPFTNGYKQIISCIDNADSICRNFPSGYFLLIRSCLYNFFYYFGKLASPHSRNNHSHSRISIEYLERMKTITKYIELHYNEEITIKKMADICNISHSYFMKFFKAHMGTSFVNYLNVYRLITAARILTTSDDSIADIATQCGFDNVSYFNRLFKRKFNCTPKSLR